MHTWTGEISPCSGLLAALRRPHPPVHCSIHSLLRSLSAPSFSPSAPDRIRIPCHPHPCLREHQAPYLHSVRNTVMFQHRPQCTVGIPAQLGFVTGCVGLSGWKGPTRSGHVDTTRLRDATCCRELVYGKKASLCAQMMTCFLYFCFHCFLLHVC